MEQDDDGNRGVDLPCEGAAGMMHRTTDWRLLYGNAVWCVGGVMDLERCVLYGGP